MDACHFVGVPSPTFYRRLFVPPCQLYAFWNVGSTFFYNVTVDNNGTRIEKGPWAFKIQDWKALPKDNAHQALTWKDCSSWTKNGGISSQKCLWTWRAENCAESRSGPVVVTDPVELFEYGYSVFPC